MFRVLSLRFSFSLCLSVILFNSPFSIICFSLILYARLRLLLLFKTSSTFCTSYRTPNRKNANSLLRRTCFFPSRQRLLQKTWQIVTLKITSLNVRGLRDDAKRREVLNWLRAKIHQYACSKKYIVSKKQIICGKQNGAIKLTSPLLKATKQQRLYTDPAGRFIICDLKANEKFLTLANIYAPNEDKPSFFYDHLLNFKCEDIIIGGDFNLVLNIEKDKKGGLAKTHQNSLKTIQEISENLDLLDVWRIYNPDDKRHTWRQLQP